MLIVTEPDEVAVSVDDWQAEIDRAIKCGELHTCGDEAMNEFLPYENVLRVIDLLNWCNTEAEIGRSLKREWFRMTDACGPICPDDLDFFLQRDAWAISEAVSLVLGRGPDDCELSSDEDHPSCSPPKEWSANQRYQALSDEEKQVLKERVKNARASIKKRPR